MAVSKITSIDHLGTDVTVMSLQLRKNGQDPWNKRKNFLLDVRIGMQKKRVFIEAKCRHLWLQAIEQTDWTDETCNYFPTFRA